MIQLFSVNKAIRPPKAGSKVPVLENRLLPEAMVLFTTENSEYENACTLLSLVSMSKSGSY
jgi:hypothetical protein